MKPDQDGAEPARLERRPHADLPSHEPERYLRRPRPLRGPRASLPILRWAVLLLLGFIVYSFGFSNKSVRTLLQNRSTTRQLEAREDSLIAERDRLLAERAGLASGQAVERYARERYHYVKPGEESYIFQSTTEVSHGQAGTSAASGD
jgi:cell division protein FtsB